jgi:phosphoenolpyruvate-protein phosphotransferase
MNKIYNVLAPIKCIVVDLVDVPDEVFSSKILGDGVAIEPLDNKIYAPISGEVTLIAKTKHAFTISHETGFQLLVHIGINTVDLNGKGFNLKIIQGQKVTQGEYIGTIDLEYIAKTAKSLITPILLPQLDNSAFTINKLSYANIVDHTHIIMEVMQTSKINQSQNSKNIISNNLIKSVPIKIKNINGIHARPAAVLVELAKQHSTDIFLEKSTQLANMRNFMQILGLSITHNDIVCIYAANNVIIEQVTNVLNDFAEQQIEHTTNKNIDSANNHGKYEENKYFGTAVSSGIAVGQLIKLTPYNFNIQENSQNTLEEKSRIQLAIEATKEDLKGVIRELTGKNDLYVSICNLQLIFLDDENLITDINSIIDTGKTAEFAFSAIIAKNCQLLNQLNNQLLAERQNDLQDIRKKVLTKLTNSHKEIIIEKPSVILCNELTPNDILTFNDNVVGIVSVLGGNTSHVVIMARSKGIPLLLGVNPIILDTEVNEVVVLNNEIGYIDLKPTNEEINQSIVAMEKHKNPSIVNVSSLTTDNVKINCLANITNVNDMLLAKKYGADGIGLFRTEFIFLNQQNIPTIDEQQHIYAQVINQMNSTCTIRTIDIGSDKSTPSIKLPQETNPALGIRGIRTNYHYPNLFAEQLQAIVATNLPNIKIMLPMITSIEEYRTSLSLLNDIKKKLSNTRRIELGVMIETPAAVMLADIFAQEVDFFSIGDNDLTQYTLAIDREHNVLSQQCDHLHPAVIRSIKWTVDAAKKYNKPVSICGLMASNKLAIPLLIGLGITNLSMDCSEILRNKEIISKLSIQKSTQLANECLKLTTTQDVKNHVIKFFERTYNEN